jgi:integrase
MGRVFQPSYWKRTPGGRKRVRTKAWYAEWQVAGKTRRKKIGTKQAAVSALARYEDAEVRRRHGLSDPEAEAAARARPLALFLKEYVELLAGRDTSADYRAATLAQLNRVLRECRWHVWADVADDAFVRFLGRLRDEPRRHPLRGAAKKAAADSVTVRAKRGVSPATLNGYLRAAKAFTRWLARKFKVVPPLADVAPYPEEVDRRRSTRILADAELSSLLRAAAAAKRKSRAAVWGEDRAMLYRLAAFTGLRAGELAELTPRHFSLSAKPPVVTVEARDAKGKREEPIPLPAHVVEMLVPWLAGRPPALRLFPGTWAKNSKQTQWLAADLKRAKVDAADDKGRPCTFHSLKRRYVVRLIQAGAKIHEVRRMARHVDVSTTLKHYTDENLADLGKLADRLPRV